MICKLLVQYSRMNDFGQSQCTTIAKTASVLNNDLEIYSSECYGLIATMFLKILFYTLAIPIILAIPNNYITLPITVFMGILYLDHIYFTPYQNTIFPMIDTTAVSADVLGASLMLLILNILQPESEECWEALVVLTLWSIMSMGYTFSVTSKNSQIVNVRQHLFLLHMLACFFFLMFVLSRCGSIAVKHENIVVNSTVVNENYLKSYMQISYFYLRSILYCFIVLIDSYILRQKKIVQHGNERVFFCKFGILLLISWHFAIVLFCCFSCIILRNMDFVTEDAQSVIATTDDWNNKKKEIVIENTKQATVDLDVLEAFQIAKQQYTLFHHGGKIN
jgi:hypothetical protein